MLTPDELAQYQQDAEDEAAENNIQRGKRLRRIGVQLLAMAATLTGISTGTGGTVEDPLDAPVLTWDGETLDLLPDVGISYEAEIGDIITLRRSTTSDFAAYEDASDTVDSLVQTLDFDFGGDWDSGTWYIKTFYTRDSEDSPDSNTVTVTIENDFLDARFDADRLIIRDSVTGANAYDGTPQGKLTATVSANGTFINASGVITQATANTLRIDYDPVTLACNGLLAEEQRINLFLNSTITGTNLATQNVTTSATAYTLSFYGTGTITLSGTSTAGPLVGTGAYPNRVTLTFTPTAGTLTCTVSGNVQYAQIEAGVFATSFIPTAGATVTRAADVVSILGSSFPMSATAWTVIAEATTRIPSPASDGAAKALYGISNNTFNESNYIVRNASAATLGCAVVDGGAGQATFTAFSPTVDTTFKVAFAVEANNLGLCFNGTLSTDATATLPTVDRLYIGSSWAGTAAWCGHIKRLTYLKRRITNTELQSLTA